MSDKKSEATEKPLEKMTVKALREIAKEIPEITGVHGMKKEELLVAINEVRGVKAETVEAEAVKEETVEAEAVKEETVEAETVEAEAVKEETVEAETVEAEAVKEEAVKEEAVKEEAVKEEAVKEEAVKEEAVEAETVVADTVKADKSTKAKPVKKAVSATGAIKKQIRALKAQRQVALEAQDRKMATVYKRRISRLKKQSRKAAA
jgi:hypothetical protein